MGSKAIWDFHFLSTFAAMSMRHFFRPVFTKRIMDRLLAGEVINLIGQDREGASRLLEDIQAASPEQVVILLADMNVYKEDYPAFLKALSDTLLLPETVVDFGEWVEALKLHGGQLILLLNHFDQVMDTYPKAFFADLNQFLLAPKLGMMVVTEKSLELDVKDIDAFFNLEQFQPEAVKLPPIGYKRILEEVNRKLPDLEEKTLLVNEAFAMQDKYGYLQFLLGKNDRFKGASAKSMSLELKRLKAEFTGDASLLREEETQGWLFRLKTWIGLN
ncbi:MAG: hypothetical protein AAFY71_16405 [Bacteroidota bacterium]